MTSAPDRHHDPLSTGEGDPEFVHRIIDALFAFVGVLSKAGALLEANTAPLKSTGASLDDVRGKCLWESLWWSHSREAQEQVRHACEQASQGTTVRFDTTVRLSDDRRVTIDFQVAPLRDRDGEVSHLVASAVDITRRKDAEEELRGRDRRKDAFIAALAHELRNPLATIPNALEILARVSNTDARALRAREAIGRQVTHLSALVDDLLDIARIGRGELTLNMVVCDLCAIAQQTAEDYRGALEGAGCTLQVQISPGRPMVRADPVRVSQMIRNFLQNAQRYAVGACVTLECKADHEQGLGVVSVSDTGQGFTAEKSAKLFELGQPGAGMNRAPAGMGLGLALTKGLAQLQGGSVAARSEGPGKGATFELAFPLVQEQPAVASPEAFSRGTSSGHRVLIVEDHSDTADTLRVLLETHGYRVSVARDGATGFALAQTWRPEIVVSDIGLPGMTGYELAESLRRNPAFVHTLLVAVSGYADENSRRLSKTAGFDIHLAKPVSPKELLELLGRDAPAAGSDLAEASA